MVCPHGLELERCPRCAQTRGEAPTHVPLGEVLTGDLEAQVAPTPLVSRIGRYVVLDVLGSGGMGLVYAAYDPVLDRKVAIKVLRSASSGKAAESSGSTRLLREAQAMAQLAHPNVVPVYDVGELNDSVFLAMELVPGLTLSQWLRAERREPRRVLEVMLGAGRGLQAAHAAGLVHRDFKPANVLVGDDGRPRVTDFGLARSTRRSDAEVMVDHPSGPIALGQPLTEAGAIMGSPGYMAPEQYQGAETSSATDQFAFCVTLYEALYGTRPFAGTDLKTLELATRAGVVPPPPKGSAVPAFLFPIIVRGLATQASARHPSMEALLLALTRDPARARRRWVVGVIAAGLGVVGVAGWGWTAHRAEQVCRVADTGLGAAWNEQRRGAVEQAFLATKRSYAQVTWDHVRDALDGWAQEWATERLDACEATRVRHEQSERTLALRLGCLDRRLEEFSTLTATLETADAELVGQASTAVSRLSAVSSCGNLKLLEARARLAPTAEQTVTQLELQLAQGRVLVAAGRFADARARIEPAVAHAQALGVAEFEAEAFGALGELERQLDRFPEAKAALAHAMTKALAAGDDRAAIEAIASLVSVIGWRLEKPAEALMLAEVGRGLLTRLRGERPLDGGGPSLTATEAVLPPFSATEALLPPFSATEALLPPFSATEALLNESTGDAQWQAGDRVASLASYRAALETTVALQGTETADVARLRSSVSWVLMEQGHVAEARKQSEQSRAIREKLLGVEHPSLAQTWNELATIAAESGEFDEAVRCFERARRIALQTFATHDLAPTR